jgi:predicted nucleic acid-binding protein
MIWIIDASVALKWLLEDETHRNAESVLERIIETPGHFAVPELFGFEVFSVINRLHPEGIEAFSNAIVPILNSGIFRHPMTQELALAADPFIKSGLTGYDACYAGLAKELNGIWLTYDKKAHTQIQEYNISCDLGNNLPAGW